MKEKTTLCLIDNPLPLCYNVTKLLISVSLDVIRIADMR